MILYLILGLYLGGGLIFALFVAFDEDILTDEEKALYLALIFTWPFYYLALGIGKLLDLFKGGMHG